MGRTVPSFRIAESLEIEGWKPFRRVLPKKERAVFDEMLNTARLYASASSSAVRPSKFEGLLIAIVFHHYKVLAGIADEFDVRTRSGERVTLSDAEIRKELEGWRGFADSLRGEDRELFMEMMRGCYEYAPSMHARTSPFLTEALFMSLLLLERKMISRLAKELEERKKGADR